MTVRVIHNLPFNQINAEESFHYYRVFNKRQQSKENRKTNTIFQVHRRKSQATMITKNDKCCFQES